MTPAAKREAVAHLRTLFEVTERRACKVLRQTADRCVIAASELTNAIVRARLRELAATPREVRHDPKLLQYLAP